MRVTTTRFRTTATVMALGLALAACGGDDGGDDGEAAAEDSGSASEDAGDGEASAEDTGDGEDGGEAASGETVGVSLILKNTSNPFFVSMEQSAQGKADELNVDLAVAAGQEDGDTQSQIRGIEDAIARGDAGILITPSGDAVVPALQQAKDAGLFLIALDTPPNPEDAVDITFATDNTEAGRLIGAWTAAALDGEKATIAMLDLFNDQVVSVDVQRDQGFLIGMGILDEVDSSGNGNEPATGEYSGGEYEVVCHEPTNGAADGGRQAMETCLAQNPDINVVYTINEPAAQGAADALEANGVSLDDVLITSVDGGCSPGLELVAEGVIGATSQQYPGEMATQGMEAIADLARGGEAPETSDGLSFFSTGVALVTDEPMDGVESISVEEGQELCWG